jgi:hypothetical protein
MHITISKAKKPKARIITDPEVLRHICLNQPQYSAEFVERSVLEGVRSSLPTKKLNCDLLKEFEAQSAR